MDKAEYNSTSVYTCFTQGFRCARDPSDVTIQAVVENLENVLHDMKHQFVVSRKKNATLAVLCIKIGCNVKISATKDATIWRERRIIFIRLQLILIF